MRHRNRHIARKHIPTIQSRFVRPIQLEKGEVVGRTVTVIVCKVHAGSRQAERDFAYWLGRLCLDHRVIQDFGHTRYVEVWGDADGLIALTDGNFRWMLHWEMCDTAHVGQLSAGSGPELSAKHRRPLPGKQVALKLEDRRAVEASAVRKQGHGEITRLTALHIRQH